MSKKSKKKSKGAAPQLLSPKKYVMTRARTLPIVRCLVTKGWQEHKMTSVVIARRHPNGHITVGLYLVDLLALGVKDTSYHFNEPETSFFDNLYRRIGEDAIEEVSYALAHNIIYGAVAFAEDHGFKPHPDFQITQFILEEDTEDVELIDIEFGVNGKPAFISRVEEFGDDDENEDYADNDDEDENKFENWTDSQWQAYLQSGPFDEIDGINVIEALFEKWYREHHHDADKENHERGFGFDIVYDAIPEFINSNETEQREIEEIFQLMKDEPSMNEIKHIERRLDMLIESNPDNPIPYNYLATCAQLRNDRTKHRKIAEETVRKFPNYLFGKLSLAYLLLEEDKIAEIDQLFNHSYSLDALYPDRKAFHQSEVVNFYSTMMLLFLRKNNLAKVRHFDHLISNMDPTSLQLSNTYMHASKAFFQKKMQIVDIYIKEKGYVS